MNAIDLQGSLYPCRLEYPSVQLHLKGQIQPYFLQGVSPELPGELSSHFSWFIHGELDALSKGRKSNQIELHEIN